MLKIQNNSTELQIPWALVEIKNSDQRRYNIHQAYSLLGPHICWERYSA